MSQRPFISGMSVFTEQQFQNHAYVAFSISKVDMKKQKTRPSTGQAIVVELETETNMVFLIYLSHRENAFFLANFTR